MRNPGVAILPSFGYSGLPSIQSRAGGAQHVRRMASHMFVNRNGALAKVGREGNGVGKRVSARRLLWPAVGTVFGDCPLVPDDAAGGAGR